MQTETPPDSPPVTVPAPTRLVYNVSDGLRIEEYLIQNAAAFQISEDPLAYAYSHKSGVGPATSLTFQRKSKYYIVPVDGEFRYYPLTLTKRNDFLYDMQLPLPQTNLEGLVVIDKKIYYVTLKDLKKKLVRLSREVIITRTLPTYQDFENGNLRKSKSSAGAGAIETAETGQNLSTPAGFSVNVTSAEDVLAGFAPPEQPSANNGGLDEDAEMEEERRLADLAGDQQIRALLGDEDS